MTELSHENQSQGTSVVPVSFSCLAVYSLHGTHSSLKPGVWILCQYIVSSVFKQNQDDVSNVWGRSDFSSCKTTGGSSFFT